MTNGALKGRCKPADSACYAAKAQGRNRIHLFAEGDEEVVSRQGEMQWVVRLQRALDENRLCLLSQPIHSLRPGFEEGAHYEMLLRMQDEDGELISPAQFLPAAERYNLMGRIDLDDPIDLAMVKCINEIGHIMGKRTIAEFVENEQVRDRLRAIGVDYAQGYGIGRPERFPSTRQTLRYAS